MDCESSRILIAGYIDEELSDEETRALKNHLQTCEGCLVHLQRMQAMHTVLKRYTFLQDAPAVPVNFARNITAQLQKAAVKQPPPLLAVLQRKYWAAVFQIVAWWRRSLRARPMIWTAAASLLLIVTTGIVFMNIVRLPSQPGSVPLTVQSETPHPALIADEALPNEQDEPIQFSGELAAAADAPEAVEIVSFAESDESLPVVDSSEETRSAFPEFIEVSGESSTVRTARNSSASVVKEYVYSHIFEALQGQFVDDMVFAGYVQDVSLK